MKDLALDIWDELREKRLWPVAVALLLALIALPILLIKPAAEPAPTAAEPQPAQGQSTPAVGVVNDSSRESSRLGVFGKKDPFRPPAGALAPSTSADGASGSSAAGASPSPATSAGSSSPSGSTQAPTGTSGSAGGGSAPAPPRLAPSPRSAYTYVVDLDFGREGHTRLRRGVPRLTVLPNERNPVAVFLGVPAGGKRAVFLLHPGFQQRGQGTCRPSRTTCNFLHLSTDPEKNGHRIVDGKGVTYLLRLKAIRRVPVRVAARASRHRAQARAGANAPAAPLPIFDDERR